MQQCAFDSVLNNKKILYFHVKTFVVVKILKYEERKKRKLREHNKYKQFVVALAL